ncbi:MAG TPA: hypothetical protein VGO93_31615 [Candidatus Xenobia bacterium]|jgi:hypothetical protein
MLDDYMEPEVAVAVAVTAVVASPKVRRVLRQGAVYGLAGLMMAGDAVTGFARSTVKGVKDAVAEADHKSEGGEAHEHAASKKKTKGAAHE